MNIPPKALAAAQGRRDAMIAAVERGDLAELERLSLHVGPTHVFERNARYRIATFGSDGDSIMGLDPALGALGMLEQYVRVLRSLMVREFVATYHGLVAFGVGDSHFFHIVEGEGAGSNAVIARGDVLAVERLDADA